MKNASFWIFSVFLLQTSIGFAALDQVNTGCGLGTLIFKGSANKTLFQIFAVTTNGTLGNQTFGITFGTLECNKTQSFVQSEKLKIFVAANKHSLAKDIAQGQGEFVRAMADLMKVPQGKRPHFYSTLQSNYGAIFPTPMVKDVEVINSISEIKKAI